MTRKGTLAVSIIFAVVSGCASTKVDTSRAESEIRARSVELVKYEEVKDFDKALTFWQPDAVVHVEGPPPIRGVEALRPAYVAFFQPVRSFRSEAGEIVVSSSGDMAYETGTNYMTVESPGGGTTSVTSKFLAVWKRSADGQWRVAAFSLTNNAPK
jgi:ketosteroid isomerase-like protein